MLKLKKLLGKKDVTVIQSEGLPAVVGELLEVDDTFIYIGENGKVLAAIPIKEVRMISLGSMEEQIEKPFGEPFQ